MIDMVWLRAVHAGQSPCIGIVAAATFQVDALAALEMEFCEGQGCSGVVEQWRSTLRGLPLQQEHPSGLAQLCVRQEAMHSWGAWQLHHNFTTTVSPAAQFVWQVAHLSSAVSVSRKSWLVVTSPQSTDSQALVPSLLVCVPSSRGVV